jgi:putative PIN family toxin of toxin-antitoxin system
VRLVLDTNILVSSLIRKNTPPSLLYRAWRLQRFALLTSTHQLAEVEDVFARPRLHKYVSPHEAHEMLRGLRGEAELVEAELVDVDDDRHNS